MIIMTIMMVMMTMTAAKVQYTRFLMGRNRTTIITQTFLNDNSYQVVIHTKRLQCSTKMVLVIVVVALPKTTFRAISFQSEF